LDIPTITLKNPTSFSVHKIHARMSQKIKAERLLKLSYETSNIREILCRVQLTATQRNHFTMKIYIDMA